MNMRCRRRVREIAPGKKRDDWHHARTETNLENLEPGEWEGLGPGQGWEGSQQEVLDWRGWGWVGERLKEDTQKD
jgi:broad specificity phosphatase PhoE